MVPAPSTLLLGLTAATSLFLVSTALPTAIPPHRYPYDSSSDSSVLPPSSSSSRSSSDQHSYGHFYAQDPSAHKTKEQASILVKDPQSPQRQHSQDDEDWGSNESKGGPLGRDTHTFQDLLLTRPSPSPQQRQHSSSSPSTSWTTPPQPPHSPFSPSRASEQAPSQQHQVDLHVNNFKSHSLTSTAAQDQILHQCTTHFLTLLDTEISDRLLAQLSRLVMMLPVIGVETRAVIRSQVAEVMQQVIAGLKNYETLGRVIRTAVDDAGIVLVVPPSEAVEANHDRSSRNSQTLTNRQDDLFTRDNSQHDQISEYDDVDDETSPSTATTATTTAQTMRTIDESQIPVLTDIAMEAVLDYMAEILTPSLVIRQLTEAIQTALFEISKQRQALHRLRVQQHESGREDEDGYMEDVNGADIELDEFSSQLLGGGRRGSGSSPADRHGVDLLSDGWILAGPSSSSRFGGEDSRLLEDEDEDEDDDPRGQDEDLWDKDMETHQWDSTGRLFEDFEDLEDSSTNNDTAESAASTMSTVTEQDMENWDMASRTAGDDGGDVEEEDDEASDPFSIGIRDNDEVGSIRRGGGTENDADGGEDEDEDDNDPMADTREDYGRERYLQQAYFNRFQKRSLFNAAAPESRKPASAPAPLVKPPTVNTARPAITLTSSATATTTATKTIRRPNLTPDLRLENLLTQLIEPLLTTFIEEDFPASCKRVQGELMDGIIWSLDQGEFNGAGGLDSDEERLLLLSELEY